MPQTKADKLFFDFTAGINTEVSPLAFPEGTSLDEENFEMMPDGTRRRRRGLALETGGESVDISALGLGEDAAFAYHRWNNVGGNSELNFVVVQVGNILHFFEDAETLSPEMVVDTVDIAGFATNEIATDTTDRACTFADGQGFLFVAGPFIEPFFVEWDPDTSEFTATQIDIRIRDFRGIQDDITIQTTPETLTDEHRYNLKNRGWIDDNITQYFTDKSVYPAKNMIPWMGYRRATETGYYDADGEKEWNSTKLENEVFGNSSAPQGSLFINPFDTASSAVDSSMGTIPIDSWSVVEGEPDPSTIWNVTVNTDGAHGLAPSDFVTISGNRFEYSTTTGTLVIKSLNGVREVITVDDTDTFTFTMFHAPNFATFTDQELDLGFVGEEVLVNPEGETTNARPDAVAWYASRVFYAGTKAAHLSDRVYFSQIVIDESQVGRCYQENDPTGENLNQTLPTDGGVIQVPGLGGVTKMVEFGSALYIFGSNGVWEIGPGGDGFFSATSYSIRKVSDVECTSRLGIVVGDYGVVFLSPRGVYALVQDSNSGFVVAQSLSDGKIQTLWNAIQPQKQRRAQCLFDHTVKRYYILYTTTGQPANFFYDRMLVFDVNRQAWYKFLFPGNAITHIIGAMTIQSADESNANKKLKFVVQVSDWDHFDICDLDHDDFEDFDGTEQIPYLLTGYDNIGDFQRRRQAPVCHVYLRRTETGVTEEDDELIPINPSSVFLEARWDWADRDITGKFSTPQQVYRHVRMYQPEDSSDEFDTGLPVIVTRNKVRGRGRALHLKFYGEEGKDAHLIGWALQYAGVASA